MHQKLTRQAFLSNLAAGRYKTGTAARRAIGRCSTWTNDDREKAHAKVDAKFGPSTMPKKAKGKKGKKRAKPLPGLPTTELGGIPRLCPDMTLEETTQALSAANQFWTEVGKSERIHTMPSPDPREFTAYVQQLISLGNAAMNRNRALVTAPVALWFYESCAITLVHN